MNIDWRSLRDFVTVAETGSLSAAAERLNISQPTVGRRIEQLEQELNAILFTRSVRGLSLTATGEQILANARQMEEMALSIERLATGANQALEGTVRVSLTEIFGIRWLPARLASFHKQFPGLHLEINVDNHNVNLLKREADIAVRMARPQQPELITRRAGVVHYGLYGSTDYLGRHGRPHSFRDLRQHHHVAYDTQCADYPLLKRFERLFGKRHIPQRTNSHLGLLEATGAGIGLGVLACFAADHDPRLERVMVSEIDFPLEVWLVTHNELARNVRIRAVFDFIGTAIEEDEPSLIGITYNGTNNTQQETTKD